MKIPFWKKKDTEEIGPPLDEPSFDQVPEPAGGPSIGAYGLSSVPPSLVHESPGTSMDGRALEKDLQLVNAKLDAIKALLDAIVQRLDKLERNPPKW